MKIYFFFTFLVLYLLLFIISKNFILNIAEAFSCPLLLTFIFIFLRICITSYLCKYFYVEIMYQMRECIPKIETNFSDTRV